MGNVKNVPGVGPVDFGDMSDEEVRLALVKKFRPPPSPSRQTNYSYDPPPEAFDPNDPLKRLRTGGVKAVLPPMKDENKPVGTPLEIADDVVRRAADTITFGVADKAVAAGKSLLGDSTYDENLAKERQQTENAANRLGTDTTLATDLGGGLLGGSALARAGLTYLGRLPATAPLISKIFRGGVEGAGYGAAQGAGHTDTGKLVDYLKNAWQGGQTGALTGAGLTGLLGIGQKVISPIHNPDPVHAAHVQALEDAGVKLSAGQATNSPKLRWAEDVGGKMPFGADTTGGQLRSLTQEVLERSGVPGAAANDVRAIPDVLKNANKQVGGDIGNIQDKYRVPVDPPVLTSAQRILTDDVPVLSGSSQARAKIFLNRLVDGDLKKNVAALDLAPDHASKLRTQLNRAINAQNGNAGDKEYQQVLIDIKHTLDEALDRTIKASGAPADADALAALRQKYANLQILNDAIARSGERGARGELSPTALAAALREGVGKKGYVTGRGDLNELAQASADILKAPPDSFTQTRANLTDPAKWAMGYPLTNPVSQSYLRNQVTTPPSGSLLQKGTAATAGPADRIMNGLLFGP